MSSVVSIDPSFLDDCHGPEVFFFSRSIGEPRVSASHLDVLMTHELLEDLQAHTRIEEFGSEGVTETVDRVAFVVEVRFSDIPEEERTGRTIAHGLTALSVEDCFPSLVPHREPALYGKVGIVTEIDHPPHAVLLPLV